MVKNKLKIFFTQGHERSIKAKKNIIASLFIKGASVVIGFLLVRVTLDYLNPTKYGIWLTLASFLTWFTFFDVGLGNGLRNKLTEALAKNDYTLGKIYVSTTYAILVIISSIVALLFFITNSFLDWTKILNTNQSLNYELRYLSFIVFGFFFLRFVLKLIGTVLYADQRPSLANSFGPIGNFIVLVVVYILTKTTHGSLIYLGWILSIVPVLILSIASIYFYSNDYKKIAPSIKYVNFKYAKNLLNLGVNFFLLQIAGLIIQQSTNIIIIQSFSANDVTIYNIAYQYFSLLNMAFSIIIMPFWAAFTEAWVKKDYSWIRGVIKKLLKIWIILSIGGGIMLVFSNDFYLLWIGDKVKIPFQISLALFIYFVIFMFSGIFNMFINGVGKIRIQTLSSMSGAAIFIGLAILSVKYTDLGVLGIILASIISNIHGKILAPIQYLRIINNTAKGIWNA